MILELCCGFGPEAEEDPAASFRDLRASGVGGLKLAFLCATQQFWEDSQVILTCCGPACFCSRLRRLLRCARCAHVGNTLLACLELDASAMAEWVFVTTLKCGMCCHVSLCGALVFVCSVVLPSHC